MSKKTIAIVGVLVVGGVLQVIGVISARNSIPTMQEIHIQVALDQNKIAVAALKSEEMSIAEKIHAVSMAAVAGQSAWPDQPEKWEYLYKAKRQLEELR
ncbi:MAG: hypothetical protein ACR2NF_12305 [Pirellulales bacterium]